jgi:hypothetical protein
MDVDVPITYQIDYEDGQGFKYSKLNESSKPISDPIIDANILRIPQQIIDNANKEFIDLLRRLGILGGNNVINIKKLFKCIGILDALKDGTSKELAVGLKIFTDADTAQQLSHPKHTHMFEEFINDIHKDNCSLHTWLKSKTETIPGPIDTNKVLITDCGATEETTFKDALIAIILQCFASWFDPFKRAKRLKSKQFPDNNETLEFTEKFNNAIGYPNCTTTVTTIGDNKYNVYLTFADRANNNKLQILCKDTDNKNGSGSYVKEITALNKEIIYKNLSIEDFKEGNGSKTQMWKTNRIKGIVMTTAIKIAVVYCKSQGDNNQPSTTQIYNKYNNEPALITTCDQVLFMISILRRVPVGLINAIKLDNKKMHQLNLYSPEEPDSPQVKNIKALHMVVSNVKSKIDKVFLEITQFGGNIDYKFKANIKKTSYKIPKVFFVMLCNALCLLMSVLRIIFDNMPQPQPQPQQEPQTARYNKTHGEISKLFEDCKYKYTRDLPQELQADFVTTISSFADFDTLITHLLVVNDAFFTKKGVNMIFSGKSLFAKKASHPAFVTIKELVNNEFADNKVIDEWAQTLALRNSGDPGVPKYENNEQQREGEGALDMNDDAKLPPAKLEGAPASDLGPALGPADEKNPSPEKEDTLPAAKRPAPAPQSSSLPPPKQRDITKELEVLTATFTNPDRNVRSLRSCRMPFVINARPPRQPHAGGGKKKDKKKEVYRGGMPTSGKPDAAGPDATAAAAPAAGDGAATDTTALSGAAGGGDNKRRPEHTEEEPKKHTEEEKEPTLEELEKEREKIVKQIKEQAESRKALKTYEDTTMSQVHQAELVSSTEFLKILDMKIRLNVNKTKITELELAQAQAQQELELAQAQAQQELELAQAQAQQQQAQAQQQQAQAKEQHIQEINTQKQLLSKSQTENSKLQQEITNLVKENEQLLSELEIEKKIAAEQLEKREQELEKSNRELEESNEKILILQESLRVSEQTNAVKTSETKDLKLELEQKKSQLFLEIAENARAHEQLKNDKTKLENIIREQQLELVRVLSSSGQVIVSAADHDDDDDSNTFDNICCALEPHLPRRNNPVTPVMTSGNGSEPPPHPSGNSVTSDDSANSGKSKDFAASAAKFTPPGGDDGDGDPDDNTKTRTFDELTVCDIAFINLQCQISKLMDEILCTYFSSENPKKYKQKNSSPVNPPNVAGSANAAVLNFSRDDNDCILSKCSEIKTLLNQYENLLTQLESVFEICEDYPEDGRVFDGFVMPSRPFCDPSEISKNYRPFFNIMRNKIKEIIQFCDGVGGDDVDGRDGFKTPSKSKPRIQPVPPSPSPALPSVSEGSSSSPPPSSPSPAPSSAPSSDSQPPSESVLAYLEEKRNMSQLESDSRADGSVERPIIAVSSNPDTSVFNDDCLDLILLQSLNHPLRSVSLQTKMAIHMKLSIFLAILTHYTTGYFKNYSPAVVIDVVSQTYASIINTIYPLSVIERCAPYDFESFDDILKFIVSDIYHNPLLADIPVKLNAADGGAAAADGGAAALALSQNAHPAILSSLQEEFIRYPELPLVNIRTFLQRFCSEMIDGDYNSHIHRSFSEFDIFVTTGKRPKIRFFFDVLLVDNPQYPADLTLQDLCDRCEFADWNEVFDVFDLYFSIPYRFIKNNTDEEKSGAASVNRSGQKTHSNSVKILSVLYLLYVTGDEQYESVKLTDIFNFGSSIYDHVSVEPLNEKLTRLSEQIREYIKQEQIKEKQQQQRGNGDSKSKAGGKKRLFKNTRKNTTHRKRNQHQSKISRTKRNKINTSSIHTKLTIKHKNKNNYRKHSRTVRKRSNSHIKYK